MANPPREPSSRSFVAAGTAVDPPSACVSAPPQAIRWNNPFIAAAGLILLVFVAYWPLTRAGFLWDDIQWLVNNPYEHHWWGLWYIWTVVNTGAQYCPLVYSGLLLQYQMWAANALGYHLVNMALQAINALLLWWILRRLGLKTAWLIAAIWAIHPVQAQTVGWVIEQKNLVSALFYFAAVLAWLRFAGLGVEFSANTGLGGVVGDSPRRTGASGPTGVATRCWSHPCAVSGRGAGATISNLKCQLSKRQSVAWYLLATLLFALALLAKTAVCTLPAVLLVLAWWRRGRLGWRDVLATVPWFVVGLAMAAVTVHVEHTALEVRGPQFQFGPVERLLIAGRALWFYPWKLIWPHPLAATYPRWDVPALGGWQWLYPATALAVPVILVLAHPKIGRGPFAAVASYGLTISPAIGLISFNMMAVSFVADHLQYLACIGLIALGTEGFWFLVFRSWFPVCGFWLNKHQAIPHLETIDQKPETGNPKRLALAGGGVVLVVLGALTWQQSRLYSSAVRLCRYNLKYYPDSPIALNIVGMYECVHGNPSAGMAKLKRAIQLSRNSPLLALLQLHAADMYYGIYHNYSIAAAYYRQVLHYNPLMPQVILRLAYCYEHLGQWPRVLVELRRGLILYPFSAALHFELANVLVMQRNYSAAARQYRDALRYEPHNTKALYNLALTLEKLGQWPKALLRFRQALRVSPRFAQGHFEYGKCLYLHGQAAAAAQQFRRVIHFWPNQPVGYRALARALAALGHPRQAAAASAEATRLQQRNSLPPPPP